MHRMEQRRNQTTFSPSNRWAESVATHYISPGMIRGTVRRTLFVLSLLGCFCGSSGLGQKSGSLSVAHPPKIEPELQTRAVDLGGGKPLSGLPVSTVIGYPTHCSSVGTTFIELYDKVVQDPKPIYVGDLYSIEQDGKVEKIQRVLPEQKQEVSIRSVYPGTNLIASLVTALPQKDPSGQQSEGSVQYYISLSKRDGSSAGLIALNLNFDVLRVAVLDSGRFLATGIDTLNRLPVLALLDTDGTLLRILDVNAAPYASSQSLGTIYKKAAKNADSMSLAAMSFANAVFAPYGSKVVLFQPASRLPVHILGEGGEENAIQLKLPKDVLLESILASSQKDTWVVRTQSLNQFSTFQSAGVVDHVDQQLFEVDPITGETLHALKVSGTNPMEITCASDNQLIALHFDMGNKDAGKSSQWTLAAENR